MIRSRRRQGRKGGERAEAAARAGPRRSRAEARPRPCPDRARRASRWRRHRRSSSACRTGTTCSRSSIRCCISPVRIATGSPAGAVPMGPCHARLRLAEVEMAMAFGGPPFHSTLHFEHPAVGRLRRLAPRDRVRDAHRGGGGPRARRRRLVARSPCAVPATPGCPGLDLRACGGSCRSPSFSRWARPGPWRRRSTPGPDEPSHVIHARAIPRGPDRARRTRATRTSTSPRRGSTARGRIASRSIPRSRPAAFTSRTSQGQTARCRPTPRAYLPPYSTFIGFGSYWIPPGPGRST